jgi:hypothetical protein
MKMALILERKEAPGFPRPLNIVRNAEDHVWFEDQWMVASLCDE